MMTIPTMDSHPIFGILNNLGTFLPHLEICLNELKELPAKDRSHLRSLDGLEGFRPVAEPSIYATPRSHRLYPRTTPMMNELEKEKSQLDAESEEVESLCKQPTTP